MKEHELSISSVMETTKNKKHYISPKIEIIGDLKDVTRGSTLGNADALGGSNPPQHPSGENN